MIRDVSRSYRRALADTVEHFTGGAYRPSQKEIDDLKAEGCWNNDWEGARELIYRYFERQGSPRSQVPLDYKRLVIFFEERYSGKDWSGYIQDEPLLVDVAYFQTLDQAQIHWGFVSGAPRDSAEYVLKHRLGLAQPLLIAMEDAPGKPDPTGLRMAYRQVTDQETIPAFYVGDTVADMQTVANARKEQATTPWIALGVIPPHVKPEDRQLYGDRLRAAGASAVFERTCDITPAVVAAFLGQLAAHDSNGGQ
ncbi:imidazoleglycerol-phosphate dehydratase [Thermosynechococcus vestitus BP-1]|uniref:Imidazoleglycerol-phosphate dehydratase n=1 Tax=Thermosynechococcus vestitus (strain NIES-2133 / IAM M-273 / BP-1) TaxID=197221 RepID=Q8DM23_THEVB|nr:imidazoleglycerol-phosphate dehydratase [Thermosynechococcus vestitus BP-1]